MNNFIFFGSDDFSIEVLDTLIENGLMPQAVITQPDKRAGRKMELTPPLIKKFAAEKGVEILQPENLKDWRPGIEADFFVVASYGKIIPKELIELPKHGSLNVHPSLLPKYRGATPIETAIVNDDKETGVSVILMDEKMDHGPILDTTEHTFDFWPTKSDIRKTLAKIGGEMLVEIIPKWIKGEIEPKEQDHDKATFTKMLRKEDGKIKLDHGEQITDNRKNYLKYLAYNPWPGVFFYTDKKTRVKITKADFIEEKFTIEKVIPEGKKEMSWKDFENGFLR
jgi:methionyl-tRNA formyltransferase